MSRAKFKPKSDPVVDRLRDAGAVFERMVRSTQVWRLPDGRYFCWSPRSPRGGIDWRRGIQLSQRELARKLSA